MRDEREAEQAAHLMCPNTFPLGLQGVENLFDRQDRMASFGPTFCDITWGAGGTTADLTLDIAAKMQNMVCVGSRSEAAAPEKS